MHPKKKTDKHTKRRGWNLHIGDHTNENAEFEEN